MKLRYHMLLTAILVICFGIIGISKHSSYTDITSDAYFVNDFQIAEIPTAFAVDDCQSLKESLPYAPIILKVTPVDSPEYFFGGRQQKFCIKEVFSGEDLQIGDEIYITADHWKVYPAEKIMDMGFVNIPQKGTDYLVFLSGSIGYSQHQIEVFRLQSGKYINPIFSYKSYENKIYPTTGEATYVPYSEVSENEFYATESEGIDAFLTLKHQLISLYQ